jgi:hypothetical protein
MRPGRVDLVAEESLRIDPSVRTCLDSCTCDFAVTDVGRAGRAKASRTLTTFAGRRFWAGLGGAPSISWSASSARSALTEFSLAELIGALACTPGGGVTLRDNNQVR